MLELILLIAKIVAVGLVALTFCVIATVAAFRRSHFMLGSMVIALTVHVVVGWSLWFTTSLAQAQEDRRIEVAILMPKIPDPPKVKPIPKLDVPLGVIGGKKDLKPKDMQKLKTPKSTVAPIMTRDPFDQRDPDFNYKRDSDRTNLDPHGDLNNFNGSEADGVNSAFGTDHGEGDGEGMPAGFPDGKIDGRVYFIRLKYNNGAWYAYDDGVKRLLGFLSKYFKCERESRPITAEEMRKNGWTPSFIYVYCDESFRLSSVDVQVLKEYINNGGFLFLDSRPDNAIKDVVTREMNKIIPGGGLRAIGKGDAINNYLFSVGGGGFGMNMSDRKNYGITKGGRLAVFYTPGNFANIYANNGADAGGFFLAQYQMGANVMVYAMNKGRASSTKYAGAEVKIDENTLQKLGLLDVATKTTKPDEPAGTVKVIKPTDPTDPTAIPDEPEEIKID